MTVAQVVEETSHWPADQVEVLFERLLVSHYRLPDPALDAEWAAELKRRIDDIESGREVGIPGEEVMARVRKIVGLRSPIVSTGTPTPNLPRPRCITRR